MDLVRDILAVAALPHPPSLLGPTYDAGLAILAALAACEEHGDLEQDAGAALAAWIDCSRDMTGATGLFGGMAGLLAGTQAASGFYPRLAPLAAELRSMLGSDAAVGLWHAERVAWPDYDLISGPAGVILAMAADPACPAGRVLPAARHLARLCAEPGLERLRVFHYREDRLRSWNFGRINTGLAHGVGGVIAALRAAYAIDPEACRELRDPLRRAAAWMVAESFIDDRGLCTWNPAGLEGGPRPSGASRRQAWCYGTPGLAWTLWDAGRVLEDAELCGFASDAMRSFCALFDEQIYLDDGPPDDALGICHGAAGTLAIADAFARHADQAEAAGLADRLEAYLLARAADVRQLARENLSLLTGASGIAAVLLARTGRPRDWLSVIALR